MNLAGTGIWSADLRHGDAHGAADQAAELEELGYSALWIPDSSGDVFTPLDNLLGATKRTVIATGILNLWMTEPSDTAAGYARSAAAHGDRLMLGLGVSHRLLIDGAREPGTYQKPLAKVRGYLDDLDALPNQGVPTGNRMLAALGPKMLELAAARTRGTHPYLITPEFTAYARELLGKAPAIAAEQGVILESDPETARAIARKALSFYLLLPNYTNNWLRHGFAEGDLADGGSDRLIDALFVWGDEEAIRARVRQHFDAGADHVCVQVLTADERMQAPIEQWRRLAPALVGGTLS
jgi:probable F420-dependent oxidoreductase